VLAAGPMGTHIALPADMASDESVTDLADRIKAEQIVLDGLVLMPPQPHADSDPMPPPAVWRDLFQTSFVGPLSLLKAGIAQMRPDPAQTPRQDRYHLRHFVRAGP